MHKMIENNIDLIPGGSTLANSYPVFSNFFDRLGMENEQNTWAQAQATDADTEPQGHNQESPPKRYPDAPTTHQNVEPTHFAQHYAGPRASNPPLDMSDLSAVLPDYSHRAQHHHYPQHFSQVGPHTNMMYPYQPAQYPGIPQTNFGTSFAQQMPMQSFPGQAMYASYPVNLPASGAPQSYPAQMLYPGQQLGQGSVQMQFQHFPHSAPFAQLQGGSYTTRGVGQHQGSYGYVASVTGQQPSPAVSPDLKRSGSSSSLQNPTVLRGPPRKPKQSGHALWVGNLPPGTNIMDLKDYFSRDATNDIESVFLISKSNCAFVNYISEQSCAAAMNRFHDSRFMGIRLVCRLRRGSAPGSTPTMTPTGPSAGLISDPRSIIQANIPDGVPPETEEKSEHKEEEQSNKLIKERFFIIKSLTMEDLERSVHNGIWATQSHNEVTLNKAYKTAENVYLIFSANKSGEYFGYARMDTPIDDEAAANLEISPVEHISVQQSSISSAADIPLTILTPATATAPRGHIIDDSARGTIFWEAESAKLALKDVGTNLELTSKASTGNSDSGNVSADDTPRSPSDSPSNSQNNAFGKPFKIMWMSTDRLPFYRTRGLRNPWNTNREVKIARDGTELEPTVGRKLVNMFGTPASGGAGSRGQQQGHHPMMPGQGPAYRPY